MKLTQCTTAQLKPFILSIGAADIQTVSTVVQGYLANERTARAHTKTRGEIRGGGRKPWRQKGTGRARAGSIRSPLWKGGGTAFGPTKERNFTVVLPQKLRQRALGIAFADRASTASVFTVDAWPTDGKTKTVRNAMIEKKIAPQRLLFITADLNQSLVQATRNFPEIAVRIASDVNAKDVLVAETLVVDTTALKQLNERIGRSTSTKDPA